MWGVRRAGRRGRAVRASIVGACALALAVPAGATAAVADTTTLEAEAMTFSGTGKEVQETSASGGKARLQWSNGTGTGSVTLPESSTHLFLRARGVQCNGAPIVEVRIDYVPVYTGTVSSTSYWEIGAPVSVAAGTHTVEVEFKNDHRQTLPNECDRNVYIDSVSIIGQPMAPTSWRNKPLADNATLAPNSAGLVSELQRQVAVYGTYVNTGKFSVPVYTVPAAQTDVRVTANPANARLQEQIDAVPLPANARPAEGSDGALAVWQPGEDTYWDFWQLRKDLLGNWVTSFGGRLESFSTNPGHWVDPPGTGFGAAATSIPLLAGVQRIAELRRGVIDHAVSMALPDLKDGHVWPAQRDDGWIKETENPNAIPEGTRFRLPAHLNADAYAITPYAKVVFRAMQRHGAVVTDGNKQDNPEDDSAVLFYAEDPKPYGTDPYSGASGIFGGTPAYQLFANFPWHLVQVVDPSVR